MTTPNDVHTIEQGMAAIVQMAGMVSRYHSGLIAEGMDAYTATILTIEYQRQTLTHALSAGIGKDAG